MGGSFFPLQNIVRDIKETMCRTSDHKLKEECDLGLEYSDNFGANETISCRIFSALGNEQAPLPDGTTALVGAERLRLPESLFYPELLPVRCYYNGSFFCCDAHFTPFPQEAWLTDKSQPRIGYQHMISNSIQNCDNDIRRELVRSIVVSGGNTLFRGFPERLTFELSEALSQQVRIDCVIIYSRSKTKTLFTKLRKDMKIIAPSVPAERKFSVFIGGSILGSLGSFHQMWISKAEYEEHGKGIVERKCP